MHNEKGLVTTVPILLIPENKYMEVHPYHGKCILNVHILFPWKIVTWYHRGYVASSFVSSVVIREDGVMLSTWTSGAGVP